MTTVTEAPPRLVDTAHLVRIATGGACVQWAHHRFYQVDHGRPYAAIVYRQGVVSLWRVDARGWAAYHLGDITARTTVRDAYLMRGRYAQRRAKEIGL